MADGMNAGYPLAAGERAPGATAPGQGGNTTPGAAPPQRGVTFQGRQGVSPGPHYGAAPHQAALPSRKFREWNKLIPVIFILVLIGFLGGVYVWLHLMPLLEASGQKLLDGQIRLSAFIVFTSMLLYCYYYAIFTDPGTIPDTPAWRHCTSNNGDEIALYVIEKKKDGDLRHCKWCAKYKPDRTHHCRVLGRCVLKMDHHCPWIYNTVGFRNHKYFFLLLLYTMCVLWLITGTFWETVVETNEKDTAFLIMFLALYEETLAAFISVVVTCFFGFHCWLLAANMTTIEFCEKQGGGPQDVSARSGLGAQDGVSKFDRGTYGNIKAALGSNPLCWFFPFTTCEGNGLVWIDENSRLTVQLDPAQGDVARKQRVAGGPHGGDNVAQGTVVQGTVVDGKV